MLHVLRTKGGIGGISGVEDDMIVLGGNRQFGTIMEVDMVPAEMASLFLVMQRMPMAVRLVFRRLGELCW